MRILKHTPPVPVGCTTFKQVEPGGEIDQPNQSEACFGEMEKVIQYETHPQIQHHCVQGSQ